VIIDEKRIITADEKMLSREVVLEKFANDKESLKIMVKDPILRVGQIKDCKTSCAAIRASSTDQTSWH
jgi:hypothetical protein